jgi:hypothetical protein
MGQELEEKKKDNDVSVDIFFICLSERFHKSGLSYSLLLFFRSESTYKFML